MEEISVEYNEHEVAAVITAPAGIRSSLWNRILQAASQADPGHRVEGRRVVLAWAPALSVLLELGSLRRHLGFSMKATGEAETRLQQFHTERQAVKRARSESAAPLEVSAEEINSRLKQLGFTRRVLTSFQLRDIQRLLSLPNGGNFSVPGAGKTTVAFALHLLACPPGTNLFIIAPKNAFGAWVDIIDECLGPDADADIASPFIRLDGPNHIIDKHLRSNARRFVMTYERLVRSGPVVSSYLRRNPTHLVLDESHRIKAGDFSQRGRAVLSMAPLPTRRDILTGTPAPNATDDLAPQLDFLWPGLRLGQRISSGTPPKSVLSGLYVRTTKKDLGLTPPEREFVHVQMKDAQLALYSVLRSEAVRQLSGIRRAREEMDIIAARRCVVRLLQASTNPVAAALAMGSEEGKTSSETHDLLAAVVNEGDSAKMLEACRLARELASSNHKTVIWTIFRHTIDRLQMLMSDINALVLHGGVPSGDSDTLDTREGRIRHFHENPSCSVIIANPAACSEAISLHKVCHNAIYLDRSYNAAHYLQSLDRIHRLGLPADVVTRVTILQSVAPSKVGSIDHSVSRRLLSKMRAMESILDDDDIKQLALDEEEAEPPVDRDISFDDLADLLDQLTTPAIPDDREQA